MTCELQPQYKLQQCQEHATVFESQVKTEQMVIGLHDVVMEIKKDVSYLKKDYFDGRLLIQQLSIDFNSSLKPRIEVLEKKTDQSILFHSKIDELSSSIQGIKDCLAKEEIKKKIGLMGFFSMSFENAKKNMGTVILVALMITALKWAGNLFDMAKEIVK
jgi:archaellum component FlaC